jgi:hypothetical protein
MENSEKEIRKKDKITPKQGGKETKFDKVRAKSYSEPVKGFRLTLYPVSDK